MRCHLAETPDLPQGLKDILEQCFGPAENRPTARRLRVLLTKVKRRRNDVIGHILRRIERHASDLEEVVAERTQALEAEMVKADTLLQEMLPRLEFL